MKVYFTFFLLGTFLTIHAQERGKGKGLVLTLYDQQSRIYGAGLGKNESTIHFYPYLIDKPFEDSMSNRYSSQDVIELYNQEPPRVIHRRIDPSEMIPVTTAEIPNQFCFFVDLRTLTEAEIDSCQSLLNYFFANKNKNEGVQITYIDRENAFYYTYINDRVPVLGNDPAWIPRKFAGEIQRVDVSRHIWKTVDGRDPNYTNPLFSSPGAGGPVVYIYLGKTAEVNSPKQEMINLNTAYRSRHDYLHYIDMSEKDTISPFTHTAKLAGGLGMNFSWGKELLTKTIVNDLVVYYLWKEKTSEMFKVCE